MACGPGGGVLSRSARCGRTDDTVSGQAFGRLEFLDRYLDRQAEVAINGDVRLDVPSIQPVLERPDRAAS